MARKNSFFKANHFYKCIKSIEHTSQFDYFTVGVIYQAFNKEFLFDNNLSLYRIKICHFYCFEEVDIGLSDDVKDFIDKKYKSNQIQIIFQFLAQKNVIITMQFCRNNLLQEKTRVKKICQLRNINIGVYQTYRTLIETYILSKYEKYILY